MLPSDTPRHDISERKMLPDQQLHICGQSPSKKLINDKLIKDSTDDINYDAEYIFDENTLGISDDNKIQQEKQEKDGYTKHAFIQVDQGQGRGRRIVPGRAEIVQM